MPYAAEVLHNEDGPILLVRAGSAAEALALAADEAASNDLAVTDTEDSIRIGWVRATPCNREGHEIRDGFEWCDGGQRCHYAYSKPGPGAFRGAFVNVRHQFQAEFVSGQDAAPVAAKGTEDGTMTESPCDRRCGYVSAGRDLLEHMTHEHARCPDCGNEPIGVSAVSHKPDCPRLQPGYAYPEPDSEAAGTETTDA